MSSLQLGKYEIHSHLFAIRLGEKIIGHVSKVDGGGWIWVRNDLYSVEHPTVKDAIDQLAADYVSSGFDNMAMQHGLITQDEKFVKGFFDQQESLKKIRTKL